MILLSDSEARAVKALQADMALQCPHMPEDTFSPGAARMN